MSISRLQILFMLGAAATAPDVMSAQASAPRALERTARATRPANATARCKDGSFTSDVSAGVGCASHQGVLVTFEPASARPQTTGRVISKDQMPVTDPGPAIVAPKPAAPPAPMAESVVESPVAGIERGSAPAPAPVSAPDRRSSVVPVAPAGATGQCKDGTFSTEPRSSNMCAANGGPAAIFPEERKAPALVAPAPDRASRQAGKPARMPESMKR